MLRTPAPLIGALGVTEMASPDSFRFKSERFDYLGELPEDYNAGNRFYGKDVAEFLKEEITQAGNTADYCDEDWGWMVSAAISDGTLLEIAIYNLSEHMEGSRPGAPDWGLSLQSYIRKKILGFVPRTVASDVPRGHIDVIHRIFESNGRVLEPWPDGSHSKSNKSD